MLSRRFLRIKAFQAVFAYKQRVKSNYNHAMASIDDYFVPNLNTMEAQDHQLLRKKAEIAKAPMIPQIAVKGIVLYKPPTSVHLYLLIM